MVKDLRYISNYIILNNNSEIGFIINTDEVKGLKRMDSFLTDKKTKILYLKKNDFYLEILDLSIDEVKKIKYQKELRIALTNKSGDIIEVKSLKNIKSK